MSLSFTKNDVSCFEGSNGAATVTAAGASGTLSYAWSNGLTTQTATGLLAGSYSVTVTDGFGCTASGSVIITQPTQLVVSETHAAIVCNGGSSTVTISASGGVAPYTGTGTFSRAVGTFSFAVTDSNGCTASVTTTITQQAALTATSVNTNASCDIRNGTITVSAKGGSKGYQYSLDGMQFQTSNIFNTAPGNHVVTVKDSLGCVTTFNSTVGLNNDLHVTVTPHDTSSYVGDNFQLTANSTATTYTWSPSTGLSDPNVANPIVNVGAVSEDITYRVTASTPEGCKAEGYVRIKAYKGSDIYVPTGFTPNHDGKNDKFTPIPVGIKKINYFRVFNRWGQMVFSSTTLNEGWDGKLGGVEQPGGVYVWMVQGIASDNRIITKKGTAVLIR
jgi:gliding motility-associated-like protein